MWKCNFSWAGFISLAQCIWWIVFISKTGLLLIKRRYGAIFCLWATIPFHICIEYVHKNNILHIRSAFTHKHTYVGLKCKITFSKNMLTLAMGAMLLRILLVVLNLSSHTNDKYTPFGVQCVREKKMPGCMVVSVPSSNQLVLFGDGFLFPFLSPFFISFCCFFPKHITLLMVLFGAYTHTIHISWFNTYFPY